MNNSSLKKSTQKSNVKVFIHFFKGGGFQRQRLGRDSQITKALILLKIRRGAKKFGELF